MSCDGCRALVSELARLERLLVRNRDSFAVAFLGACVRDVEARVRAHELEHAAFRTHESRHVCARAEQASIDHRG